jgi:ketosteroid isomerase-like protein
MRGGLMESIRVAWLLGLALAGGRARPLLQAQSRAAPDAALQATLAQVDAAQQEFHNGRPAAMEALWSHEADVTLAGGAGGAIEKGWAHVRPRLEWASSHYAHGLQSNERIEVSAQGDIAYVVQLEHIRFHVPGQAQESKRDYRVTMVLRRETGGWRIVHRQADTQLTTQPPR